MNGYGIRNTPPWDDNGLSLKVGDTIAAICAAIRAAEQKRRAKTRSERKAQKMK